MDPHQQISYRGQELYKKRSADVNLEDAAAVRTLMEMFLGTQASRAPCVCPFRTSARPS